MELLTQHAIKHLGYSVYVRYEITEIKNCDMKIRKWVNDKNTYQVQAVASRTDLLYQRR